MNPSLQRCTYTLPAHSVYRRATLITRQGSRRANPPQRGRASIGHDGHGRLRTALYMATLSAARYNPAIRAFYERLRAAGKPLKVARCAAARKLLHLAWALGTKRQHFDPDHEQQQHAALPDLAA